MKALIDHFWMKYSQLQLAVGKGDPLLIEILDREVKPLLHGIYEAKADTIVEAREQFQFVLELLRRESDDVSSVLRQCTILRSMADRYFFDASDSHLTTLDLADVTRTYKRRADEGFLNEAILDSLPDRVAVITPDYRYLYSNPTNAVRLEERPMNLIGRHVVEFVGIQRFEQRVKPNLDRCFAGESLDYTYAKTTDGRTTVVRCRMNPCLSSRGKPIGAILIIQEIADRRRAIAA